MDDKPDLNLEETSKESEGVQAYKELEVLLSQARGQTSGLPIWTWLQLM